MSTDSHRLTECGQVATDALTDLERGGLFDPAERAAAALARVREIAESGTADPDSRDENAAGWTAAEMAEYTAEGERARRIADEAKAAIAAQDAAMGENYNGADGEILPSGEPVDEPLPEAGDMGTSDGLGASEEFCPRCEGGGKVWPDGGQMTDCPVCAGSGKVGEPTAEIRLSIPMDAANAAGAARVGQIVTAFVEDHRASLHVGGFVSGPITDMDGERVGRYSIEVPLS